MLTHEQPSEAVLEEGETGMQFLEANQDALQEPEPNEK